MGRPKNSFRGNSVRNHTVTYCDATHDELQRRKKMVIPAKKKKSTPGDVITKMLKQTKHLYK